MAGIKYRKKEEVLSLGKYSKTCGMNEINSAGRIMYGNSYSIMYEIEKISGEADIFSLLRFYDVRFKILMDLTENKKYIIVCADYDNNAQADNDMNILCNDIVKNINLMNCSLRLVQLNERMRIIHKMSMGGMYINTDNYTKSGDWVKEISLVSCKDKAGHLLWVNSDSEDISKKVISHINVYYSAKVIEDICKLNAEYIYFDFADISDNAAGLFINSNYIGLEELELEIKEKNEKLYEVIYGGKKDNKKNFVLAGLYAVIGNGNLELINKKEWNLCNNIQKKMYNSIIPNGNEEMAQQRICYCEQLKNDINFLLKENLNDWCT